MTKLTDYVMQRLAKHVKHIFYVPGGGAMHLVDSLGNTPGITPVCCLHEQGASYAAQAYGMYSGLGVCVVTTGPGATNSVSGVLAAYMDSYPLIVISGQVKTATMKRDLGVRSFGSQEVDIVSGIKAYTKYAITVMDADDIRDVMNKALSEAINGRNGPVWVDIPLDIQAREI